VPAASTLPVASWPMAKLSAAPSLTMLANRMACSISGAPRWGVIANVRRGPDYHGAR